MGYFSNGTEGMIYETKYCEKCMHCGDEEDAGCPVWMIHMIYNYGGDGDTRTILNIFIPQKDCQNQKCAMFIESKEDRETKKLF